MSRRRRHHRTAKREIKKEIKKQKNYKHLYLIVAGIALATYLEGLITGYLIGKQRGC